MPTFGNPNLQQFVRTWSVIPYGDRRNSAKSGRAEDQNELVPKSCNDIVRIFVVRDSINQ